MLHDEWLSLIARLRAVGEPVSPRGEATREEIGARLALTCLRDNVLDVPARRLNHRFMVAEWLWMEFGLDDLEILARYNPNMRRYSDDGKVLSGAYGPRIAAQRRYALDALRRDQTSRQAVVQIWREAPRPSKDVPCTLSLQFLIRRGLLHLIMTMRSSDAFLGVPYDVFSLTQIASGAAGELGVEPGMLVLQLGSSHLYERDVDRVDEILATRGRGASTVRSPALPGPPPAWLHRVLERPDEPPSPGEQSTGVESVWRAYADALRARTSAEALRILKEVSSSHADPLDR